MPSDKPDQSDVNFSHLDGKGNLSMVDVGTKDVTRREASARATVRMTAATIDLLVAMALPKGDVLTTARVAGILAAKQTSSLIPLTHPLAISFVDIRFEVDAPTSSIAVTATVRCEGKTGVEIEAMTACSIACLTIYDMCKSVERGIVIDGLRLVSKSGGKTGDWVAGE
ncbi:MAG TPA: cyclic pyranopterin monophosphate synthase MoaC [Thermoanaerobaculia bacterium]|nr:cyclic pyranopterin monophosphate synthase MoaC [Thermoanaerobaculia bacterium]